MRGTRHDMQRDAVNLGIIPAHAGNTPSMRSSIAPMRDHPRACGEHLTERSGGDLDPGSSPRMRGTLGRGDDKRYADGIIPAHAGNTQRSTIGR